MQDLAREYAAAVTLWRELNESTPGLSAPFVVAPDARYRDAAVRLMIVGQETFGWGEGIDRGQSAEQLVEILREWYRSFNLGANYRSTPFWSAADHIFRSLNPSTDARAFLWSNLVKMDMGRRRVTPEVEERVAALRLLQREISEFSPEVVVFFTGPRYDERLAMSFPGARFETAGPLLARVIHADLPTRTFRTYHPRYLRMSRHWGVLDELISRCKVAYGADFNPATLHDRPSHEAAFRELVQHWEPAST